MHSTWYNPTRLLDYKLQPIFDHIRKRHINNVHQLQTHNQIQSDKNAATLPIFFPKNERLIKLESLKMKTPYHRVESLHKKQSSKSPNRVQRIYMASTTSKVKKHLIETIDYLGIEKALFKPKQRKTLYQSFYQTIMEKDKWMHQELYKTMSVDSKGSKKHKSPDQNVEVDGKSSILGAVAKKISRRPTDKQKMQKFHSLVLDNK